MKTFLFLLTFASLFTVEPCKYFLDLPAATMPDLLRCNSAIVGGADPEDDAVREGKEIIMKFDIEFQKILPYTYRVLLIHATGTRANEHGEILIYDGSNGPEIRWINNSWLAGEKYGQENFYLSGILRVQDSRIISPDCSVDTQGTTVQMTFIYTR